MVIARPGRHLVLAAALVASGAQVAGAAPSLPETNSTTYADERGEQPGAPDISKVIVSNDDAGSLTFRVLTPGRQRLTQDMRVRIWFWLRERQYFLLVDPFKPPGATVGLYRVDQVPGVGAVGSMINAPSLRFRYARGARFTVHASDLALDPSVDKRVAITFYALLYSGVGFTPGQGYDFAGLRDDRAPSKHPRRFRYVAVFDA